MPPSTAPKKEEIPPVVQNSAYVPPPQLTAPLETYSVSVVNVPVNELLFALARDAGLNIDVHPGISHDRVTINAISQTLPQILERISKQTRLRYQMEGNILHISPDLPYVHSYKVNYVNMSRDSKTEVKVATQITSGGSIDVSQSSGSSASVSSGDNNSKTEILNTSNNRFWETLQKNIIAILVGETEATTALENKIEQSIEREGGMTKTVTTTINKEILNNNVIVSPESGTITVRATARQHEEIQRFLNQVLGNVQRQVLIEATVAEVQLSNEYQAGIDWQRIAGDYRYIQSGANLGVSPFYSFKYSNSNSQLGNISATLNLLEQFGQVKVLSSPKIMTLNNQTAVIRVADNIVYFGTSAIPYQTVVGNTIATTFRVTTTPKVVPVGLIMNITPQISDNDEVTLNVRPTITRVIGYVVDPNPDFADSKVGNKIPEIQVREMESILKVNHGDIAVMGGLMQDTIEHNTTGIPVLSKLPLVGDLFSQRNDKYIKTELVIFLRPLIVRDASINGDLREYKPFLLNPAQPEVLPPTGLTR